ncbi:hypothetical protein HZC32_02815, partial [Candidatus Woesearchaeota archaeon]|nr:hypothetical protein [Candidatus Woesearchaeota archaeon]
LSTLPYSPGNQTNLKEQKELLTKGLERIVESYNKNITNGRTVIPPLNSKEVDNICNYMSEHVFPIYPGSEEKVINSFSSQVEKILKSHGEIAKVYAEQLPIVYSLLSPEYAERWVSVGLKEALFPQQQEDYFLLKQSGLLGIVTLRAEELKDYKKKLEEAAKSVDEAESGVISYIERSVKLEAEIKESNRKLEEAEDKLREYAISANKCDKEIQLKLKEATEDFDEIVEEKESKITSLESKLQEAVGKSEEAQKECQKYQSQFNEAGKKIEQYQKEIEQYKNVPAEQRAKLTEDENKVLKDKNKSFKKKAWLFGALATLVFGIGGYLIGDHLSSKDHQKSGYTQAVQELSQKHYVADTMSGVSNQREWYNLKSNICNNFDPFLICTDALSACDTIKKDQEKSLSLTQKTLSGKEKELDSCGKDKSLLGDNLRKCEEKYQTEFGTATTTLTKCPKAKVIFKKETVEKTIPGPYILKHE